MPRVLPAALHLRLKENNDIFVIASHQVNREAKECLKKGIRSAEYSTTIVVETWERRSKKTKLSLKLPFRPDTLLKVYCLHAVEPAKHVEDSC